jgi:hypothetical protein
MTGHIVQGGVEAAFGEHLGCRTQDALAVHFRVAAERPASR